MRPGIGQNASCTVGDFVKQLGLPFSGRFIVQEFFVLRCMQLRLVTLSVKNLYNRVFGHLNFAP